MIVSFLVFATLNYYTSYFRNYQVPQLMISEMKPRNIGTMQGQDSAAHGSAHHVFTNSQLLLSLPDVGRRIVIHYLDDERGIYE